MVNLNFEDLRLDKEELEGTYIFPELLCGCGESRLIEIPEPEVLSGFEENVDVMMLTDAIFTHLDQIQDIASDHEGQLMRTTGAIIRDNEVICVVLDNDGGMRVFGRPFKNLKELREEMSYILSFSPILMITQLTEFEGKEVLRIISNHALKPSKQQ